MVSRALCFPFIPMLSSLAKSGVPVVFPMEPVLLYKELHTFTKLKSVTFHARISVDSDRQKSITNYLELLDTMTNSIRKVHLYGNFNVISMTDSYNIQPVPYLRRLSITFGDSILQGHDENLLYLMKKFPSLDYLQLSCEDHEQYIHIRNSTIYFDFLDYVSKIPIHLVQPLRQPLRIDSHSNVKQVIGHYLKKAKPRQIWTLSISFSNFSTPNISESLRIGIRNNAVQRANAIELICVRQYGFIKLINSLENLRTRFKYLKINNISKFEVHIIDGILQHFRYISHLTMKGSFEKSMLSPNCKPLSPETIHMDNPSKEAIKYLNSRFSKLETLSLSQRALRRVNINHIVLEGVSLKRLVFYFPKELDMNCDIISIKLHTQDDGKTKVFGISVNKRSNVFIQQAQNVDFMEKEFQQSIPDKDALAYTVTCGMVEDLLLEDSFGRKLLLISESTK